MSSLTGTLDRPPSPAPRVDPRAPRFGQAITASGLLAGIALGELLLVAAIAVVLSTAVLSRWRLQLYAVLWRHVAVRVLGPSEERESAIPHRFATLLGAVGSSLATLLLLAGFPLAGYVVAVAIAAAAALGATTGFCLACQLYGQVAFFRRLNVV